MTAWVWATLVLAVVGLVPGLIRAATGTSLQRLVGLQLVGAVLIMITIALSVAVEQGSYLIVPLALVLMSAAGTLVFTRLLRSDGADQDVDERVEESGG